jgi:hypothetical protein
VAARLWPTTPLAAWLEGQRSLSPPGRFPWCACALRLGVRAGLAAGRPIRRTRGRGGASSRRWGGGKRREGKRYGG